MIALLGAWLVIFPWALSYVQEYTATGNSILIGVVVATHGIARAYGAYRSSWLSWINALIGGWAVAGPWILTHGQGAARTNSVVVGVARAGARRMERDGTAGWLRNPMTNNNSCHEVS